MVYVRVVLLCLALSGCGTFQCAPSTPKTPEKGRMAQVAIVVRGDGVSLTARWKKWVVGVPLVCPN